MRKSPEQAARRPPGRPRDAAIGRAILAAARELVIRHGYEGVTTQMIAETAGAGKQTIYRRWPSKAELVLAAFVEHARTEIDHGTGSLPLRDELADFLTRTFAALERSGPAIRSLMASAQHDEAFRAAFRARFIEPRRDAVRALLAAAVERGELAPGADLETATLALYGSMWYRLLLAEPLDAAFAGRLADFIVAGLRRRLP
jgi:AcrR family transcriptional regulator